MPIVDIDVIFGIHQRFFEGGKHALTFDSIERMAHSHGVANHAVRFERLDQTLRFGRYWFQVIPSS